MVAALPPPPPAVVSTVVVSPVAADGTYRVRSGDTVGGIALRYGVDLDALLAANGIGPDHRIRAGQTLVLPRGDAPTVDPSAMQCTTDRPRGAPVPAVVRGAIGRAAIVDAAERYGVDPSLALAVGWQESRWRQNAVSHKGAVGVMQCMPSAGEWMSQKAGRTLDLHDVGDNAVCGVLLLRTLQENAAREETVLAAYYQGMTSVKSEGMYGDTRDYVRSVQAHRDQIAAGVAPHD